MPVDHTRADATLAIWNGTSGIAQIPAASGTADLSGPKKRPRNMPSGAPLPEEGLASWQQIGMPRQWPKSGYRVLVVITEPIRKPVTEHRTKVAANQIGQKPMPLAPTIPPIPNRMAVAGSSSEMNASNSPKARTKTIGAAQLSCVPDEQQDRIVQVADGCLSPGSLGEVSVEAAPARWAGDFGAD